MKRIRLIEAAPGRGPGTARGAAGFGPGAGGTVDPAWLTTRTDFMLAQMKYTLSSLETQLPTSSN